MIPIAGLPPVPRWAVMWSLAILVYALLKLLAWSLRSSRDAAWWKHAAFLVAWPGMDADAFLYSESQCVRRATLGEWLFAGGKFGFGLGLVCGARLSLEPLGELAAGWIAMVGLVFSFHFGLFHVLSCLWRSVGLRAEPIMDWPILANNVADFWGRRWNRAFRDLAHRTLFNPLSRSLGPTWGLMAGFLASGLIHDLVISVPAGGGYGGPTLYFLMQAIAIGIERSASARRFSRQFPRLVRAGSMAVIALASPLAFHRSFVVEVIVPFTRFLGESLVFAWATFHGLTS